MSVNKVHLSELPAGETATLAAFDASVVPVARLMALGLRQGDAISVLTQTPAHEPVVVCRGSMRIVVDARLKAVLLVHRAS